jgi:anti-repressor protein
MSTEIQPFEFEGNKVRTLADGDEVMFVASDIAKILGYRDAANLARNLDNDERGIHEVSTPSGTQNMTVLTESGLYRAILNRETAYVKNEEAQAFVKRFQRWVTHEVLPSIRKHGAYMTQQTLDKALTSPDFLIQLATKLKEEQEKVKELEPKAKALDDFTNVPDALLVRDAAKLLSNDSNIQIGEHELRQWLVDNGWIYRQSNQSWCAASSRVRQGHMVMVSSRSHGIHKDGTPFAYPPTPKLTRKGLALIHQRLSEQSFERVLDAEVAA